MIPSGCSNDVEDDEENNVARLAKSRCIAEGEGEGLDVVCSENRWPDETRLDSVE